MQLRNSNKAFEEDTIQTKDDDVVNYSHEIFDKINTIIKLLQPVTSIIFN